MIPSGRRSLVVPSCGGVTPCRSPAKVPRSGVIWLDATAFCDQGLGRGLFGSSSRILLPRYRTGSIPERPVPDRRREWQEPLMIAIFQAVRLEAALGPRPAAQHVAFPVHPGVS